MPHMPLYGDDGSSCAGGSCGSARIVTYVITGAEDNAGVDFMVPIGAALALDTYEVGLFGTAGSSLAPVIDFPNALAGDRTTSEFRVLLASALGVGDILKFQIVEAS